MLRKCNEIILWPPSKTQRTFQKREVNDQSAWRKSGIRGRSSFLRGWKWRQSSWSRGCGDSHYHIDLRQGLSLYKNSTKMTRWGVLIRGSDTISGQESDIFTSFPVPQPSPTAWGPGDGVRAGGEKLPESRTLSKCYQAADKLWWGSSEVQLSLIQLI